jgi:N4-gp56 family major capsid protein
MADTVFALNAIPATTILSEDLLTQSLYSSVVSRFIGDDDDAMVRILPDLTRRAGDTIDYELELNLVGPGVLGFDQLEGNEEAMNYVFDGFSINDIAHAVSVRGQMTLQRVPWALRKRAHRKWLTRRMNVSFVNQLAGNTSGAGLGVTGVSAGDLRFLGLNATQAPSSTTLGGNREVFPTGITTEAGLTSAGTNGANQLQLPLINSAVTKAESALFPVRPIIVNGEPFYVLFAHPFAINDLKNVTGEGTWQHIQLQVMSSGNDYVKNNPLFTGAIGMYNRCIIHKDMHVPFGDTTQANANAKLGTSLGAAANGTTSVTRSIFCGANAGVIAFGRHTSWPSQVKWVEVAKDYNRKLGVSCELVFGMKKSWFTYLNDSGATDFATIIIGTWANAQ